MNNFHVEDPLREVQLVNEEYQRLEDWTVDSYSSLNVSSDYTTHEWAQLPWWKRKWLQTKDYCLRWRERTTKDETHQNIVFGFLIMWLGVFLAVFYYNNMAAVTDLGKPQYLGCDEHIFGDFCDINAQRCTPFHRDWYTIQCPIYCEYHYSAVTGSGPYRGDSPPCRAALHAGLIDGVTGGCFAIRWIGGGDGFKTSKKNTIRTYSFPWLYPMAYELKAVDCQHCHSLQAWILVLFAMFFTSLVLIKPPSQLLFYLIMFSTFWYTKMVADSFQHTPWDRFNHGLADCIFLFSAGYWMWRVSSVHSFPGPEKPWSRLFLFIVPAFLTCHLAYIAMFRPDLDINIDADLLQHSGFAKTVIFAFLGLTLAIFISAVAKLYKEGLLVKFVKGYAVCFIVCGFLFLIFPADFSPHLHHFFFPLVVWPVTRIKSKWMTLGAGLLLGIFINGLALWGVAPPFDHYASNWVYLPAPPTPYYELNATDTTVTIAWEKDAFHGKAPGHMLYMNDIPVMRDVNTYGYNVHGLDPFLTYRFTLAHYVPSGRSYFYGYRSPELLVNTREIQSERKAGVDEGNWED